MVPAKRALAPTKQKWKSAKKSTPIQPSTGIREKWHSLANDPGLNRAGVEVGARAIFQPNGSPQMRIVFRAGDKESSVECVHVALYSGSLESLPSDVDLVWSSEGFPLVLDPEEHFFALNSYVAGIAEVGIGAMFAAARDAGNLPVGFNVLMQQQILRALLLVVPVATLDFCLWVIDDVLIAERNSRLASEFLAPVKEILGELLSYNSYLPPEVLERLAADEEATVRRGVARHKYTPSEILAHLARDEDASVRRGVARNENSPPAALANLVADKDAGVRWAVAGNEHTPRELFPRLAEDKNELVRKGLAGNEQVPSEILTQLAKDPSASVREKITNNKHTTLEVLSQLASDE
ncbi:MAG: hypothetical protein RBG13Loki_3078 [Promethearchaeota archaeon CR_4]|nr:MAG: hypothetical protein RBG13Loki_3078 [Candidatus Lokiarchaeota archaeon CR_4]